jgi:acetolactate synthase-1/2/3 large subunit
MTVAEYIADKLVTNGVRFVFGIPGGPSIPYMDAFRKAGIEFILTSHESAAGVMADVSARLTGVPGVCHATFGPGAVNLASGTGLAYLDRSPMLVFTTEVPDELRERTVQMNINHQELFKPVTKKTFRLSPGNIERVIDEAIFISGSEYPGPVHIGLPSDIAGLQVNLSDQVADSQPDPHFENNIPEILRLLENSRRPLLAIGLTSARLGIRRLINQFLSGYPVPVVLTPMAKGLITEDHPCYAGVLFHALSDCLDDIFRKTDLVIGLGYDPVEFNYESWMPDVPLVHFDTRETDLPPGISHARFTGLPSEWFNLLRNLNQGALVFEKGIVQGIRDEMQGIFGGFLSHFGPVSVLRALREELPADAIVTADVGSHLHVIGQYWRTPAVEKLIMTNGWSSMGFGIPAANAVKLNIPEAAVFCITGDGGFIMSAGEIITARRYHLPVKIVVLSDGELNLIKLKQGWKEILPYGTMLYDGDLFGSDTFFGVKVLTVKTDSEMREAVRSSLAADAPVIINAVIDPEDYKWLVVRPE